MAKKTPLQLVKEMHGGKDKLVDKLMGLVERGEESKDELKTRLKSAANSKLLRLHDVLTEIQEQFGSKEKLVDGVLDLKNRVKDTDYRDKLLAMSPTRLMDLYRSTHRKSRAA